MREVDRLHLNCVACLTVILGGPRNLTLLVWLMEGNPGTEAWQV